MKRPLIAAALTTLVATSAVTKPEKYVLENRWEKRFEYFMSPVFL